MKKNTRKVFYILAETWKQKLFSMPQGSTEAFDINNTGNTFSNKTASTTYVWVTTWKCHRFRPCSPISPPVNLRGKGGDRQGNNRINNKNRTDYKWSQPMFGLTLKMIAPTTSVSHILSTPEINSTKNGIGEMVFQNFCHADFSVVPFSWELN